MRMRMMAMMIMHDGDDDDDNNDDVHLSCLVSLYVDYIDSSSTMR
jgi:hypothetical protein